MGFEKYKEMVSSYSTRDGVRQINFGREQSILGQSYYAPISVCRPAYVVSSCGDVFHSYG